MKFNNIRVYNFENALRGMRNPKESWHLSDSEFGFGTMMGLELGFKSLYKDEVDAIAAYKDHILHDDEGIVEYAFIGEKDMELAKKLIKAGPEHRKFLRQIFVSVDITAPLYWWKEFDTYKVGTVANSTSTMHTIHTKPITKNNFELGDYEELLGLVEPADLKEKVDSFINTLEQLRQLYLRYSEEAKTATDPEEKKELAAFAKKYWKELIRWTPNSWLQTRTVTMSYENLLSICSPGQRRFHKLTEWSKDFINFARQLPYAQLFIFTDEVE